MTNEIPESEKYPKGHFIERWIKLIIPFFLVLSIPISLILKIFELIPVGVLIGIISGLIIGQKVENSYANKGLIRNLNEDEKAKRKKMFTLIVPLLLVVIIALIFLIG